MTVDQIIDGIIEREGRKYTNLASDRGGPTKFGITLADLSSWRKRKCTADDVKALQEPEARAIYETRYISEPGFAQIIDLPLRVQLIDFGVNSGPERAVRWLQRAIGTPVTGQIDATMLDLLPRLPARLVNNALVAARLYMIESITDEDVKQKANEEGWEHRALVFFIRGSA